MTAPPISAFVTKKATMTGMDTVPAFVARSKLYGFFNYKKMIMYSKKASLPKSANLLSACTILYLQNGMHSVKGFSDSLKESTVT